MANHSQHQQGNSAGKRGGAAQAVVELCAVSACGLVFWSRQRFDIGSELQIRVLRSALPQEHTLAQKADAGEWVTVTGFVVECPAVRRPNGEHGFQVSLLLESTFTSSISAAQPARHRRQCPKMRHRIAGLKQVGLN